MCAAPGCFGAGGHGSVSSIWALAPARIADWKQSAICSIKTTGFSGMGSKSPSGARGFALGVCRSLHADVAVIDVSSEGRATAGDAVGRRFEPGTSFHWIAQSVRASDQESDCRGFDSRSKLGRKPFNRKRPVRGLDESPRMAISRLRSGYKAGCPSQAWAGRRGYAPDAASRPVHGNGHPPMEGTYIPLCMRKRGVSTFL
jgi:hypothetical protein